MQRTEIFTQKRMTYPSEDRLASLACNQSTTLSPLYPFVHTLSEKRRHPILCLRTGVDLHPPELAFSFHSRASSTVTIEIRKRQFQLQLQRR